MHYCLMYKAVICQYHCITQQRQHSEATFRVFGISSDSLIEQINILSQISLDILDFTTKIRLAYLKARFFLIFSVF